MAAICVGPNVLKYPQIKLHMQSSICMNCENVYDLYLVQFHKKFMLASFLLLYPANKIWKKPVGRKQLVIYWNNTWKYWK